MNRPVTDRSAAHAHGSTRIELDPALQADDGLSPLLQACPSRARPAGNRPRTGCARRQPRGFPVFRQVLDETALLPFDTVDGDDVNAADAGLLQRLQAPRATLFLGPPGIEPQLARIRIGEFLGDSGTVFTRHALEALTAWGKTAYRKSDNMFVPMLTDGTSLEGYRIPVSGYFGPEGARTSCSSAPIAAGSRCTGRQTAADGHP